jgi:hypothetical protein
VSFVCHPFFCYFVLGFMGSGVWLCSFRFAFFLVSFFLFSFLIIPISLSDSFPRSLLPSSHITPPPPPSRSHQCYLRLSTPHHASQLISYFSKHRVVQTHSLDDAGVVLEALDEDTEPSPTQARMTKTMHLILDRAEAIYWEKVPLKVREEAVRRAARGQRSCWTLASG